MLCRKVFHSLKLLGCATKMTFAQGHGYSLDEIKLMEKERQGHVSSLQSEMTDEWYIPKHILVGQAFSYETELFSFVKRIGCNQQYVSESCRMAGEESELSSALVVALAHHSSCSDANILQLKNDICNLGRKQLTTYIMNFFQLMFPNITSEILYQLSVPETCLSSAKCFSLYKHICLHELIRTKSGTALTLEEYSDVIGGVFLSILLFDKHPYISAPLFLESCILNNYSQLDFRDIINYDDIGISEKKLVEYLTSKNRGFPEIRMISIDGEDSPVPTYEIGIFVDDECIATAADHSIESASLHACNAALTSLIFSDRNPAVSIKSMDFEDLPDEIIRKKIEFQKQLQDILKDVDLSKSELDYVNRDKVVFSDNKSFESLKNLRQMRYK